MIDIDKCMKIFNDYVEDYDMNDEKIYLKYYHTYRVVENCINIAKSLNLNGEDTNICILTGLLHDIGRFDQVKIYGTFNDKESVDHASLGVEILKTNNFISEFVDDKNIQDIVLTAIETHNKFEIDESLDDRTTMFCKIIRDTDKLDIFKIFLEGMLSVNHTDSYISDDVLDCLLNCKQLNDKDLKTKFDYYLRQFAFLYDLNYEYSINKVKNDKIADKLIDVILENNEHKKNNLVKIKKAFYDRK